ncbi:MAG: AMP-binding protein [Gammaproteobacteria bacterium]|nr:AMP-binding protein [Gammaproteobacteria bacterium]
MTGQRNARQTPIIVSLLRLAADRPSATVFIHGEQAYSAAYTASQVVSVANDLKKKSFPTNTLALSLANSPEFVFAFLAGNLCGLNVQVLNAGWPVSLLQKTITALRPDWLLHDGAVPLPQPALPYTDIPQEGFSSAEFLRLAEQCADTRDLSRAFYTGFTSGSGGVPKGFVRSEASWLQSFALDKKEFSLDSDDVIVCPGSFAHSLFLYALLRGIDLAVPVLTFSRFHPAKIINKIQDCKASIIYVVPTQLQALHEAARNRKVRLDSVRLVLSSGEKLPLTLRQSLIDTMPEAEICEFYGSSELSYISVCKPADCPPAGSVGRVLDGVEVDIRDESGRSLSANESGRIFVKSPLRFIGYAEQGGKTNLRSMPFSGGFLGSGDTGYLDDNGFLFITGRSDRMITTSGHTINPEEIEAVLLRVDGVRHAAVIPIDDSRRGQRLLAILAPQPGTALRSAQLTEFCARYLPDYMVPRMYYTLNEWPLTVSHKTDYPCLQKLLADGRLFRLETR